MKPARRELAVLVAFMLSGFAGLSYELTWTRLLGLSLGSELLGIYGVLAGFFGGMAIGAWLWHGRARRDRRPTRSFARLELYAAGFALLSPDLFGWLARALPAAIGPTAGDLSNPTAVIGAVAVAGLCLLPATIPMGATLPLLVEATRRRRDGATHSQSVGRLYAANTMGAVLGVLLASYVLHPALGLRVATWIAAGAAALAAAVVWRHEDEAPSEERDAQAGLDTSGDPDPDVQREPWLLGAVMFITGCAGVGLQVVGLVVLGQALENTVFTFANVLVVYLIGTAIGSAAYAAAAPRLLPGRPARLLAYLLVALALSVIGAALFAAPDRVHSMVPEGGASTGAHLWAELAVAAAVFAVPTVLMGATFAHTASLVAQDGLGRAYGLNTLGAALAPFIFGIVVIERFGYTDAWYAVAFTYLAAFALFTWFRRFRPVFQIVGMIVVIGAAGRARGSEDDPLLLMSEPEGWKRIHTKATPQGAVVVSEETRGESKLRRLRVGKRFRMGGAHSFGEQRMGHLPLLLHGTARSALFLGVGTGATAGAAVHYPLERIVAVELATGVLDVIENFADINGGLHRDARVRLEAADARRYAAGTAERFDVIVADLFHPGRDGAGSLYTVEHFQNVATRLEDGGLFVQWLPLYQLDEASARSIVAAFLQAFPYAESYLAIFNANTPALGLLGANAPLDPIQWPSLEALLGDEDRARLAQPTDVLAAHMLGHEALRDFAGDTPPNRDLRPTVTYWAPHGVYLDPADRDYATLNTLMDYREPIAAERLNPAGASRDAIDAHHQAATAYLRGELRRASQGGQADGTAVGHYLDAYRATADFAPARGTLYRLAASDPALAEDILPAMIAATPERPRPHQAWITHLRRLGDEAQALVAVTEAERLTGLR